LDKKRLQRVTSNILAAAAQDLSLVTRLLDHDPTYAIASNALDDIAHGFPSNGGDLTEISLRQDDCFVSSTENVSTVLRQSSERLMTPRERPRHHMLSMRCSCATPVCKRQRVCFMPLAMPRISEVCWTVRSPLTRTLQTQSWQRWLRNSQGLSHLDVAFRSGDMNDSR